MPDCTSSLTPYGSSTSSSAVSLSVVPVASMVSESVATSTTLARNICTISSTWLRVPGVGAHLDEHDLPLHGRRGLELDDLEHLDELVELLGHLLQREVLDVDDDRHPGDVRVLGLAHGEGVDVEAAPGEQRGDAGEDAGLVLDEDGQGVLGHGWPSFRSRGSPWGSRRGRGRGPARRPRTPRGPTAARCRGRPGSRSLLTPAGTIGHTMASRCTTKSTTTGRSLTSIAARIVASTSSGRSQRRPTQP